MKAIIVNGLGFVSRPLYLFPQKIEETAIEYLLREGIEAQHLNDKLGILDGQALQARSIQME
ncbi:MAG: hypothetical protein NVSMB70_01990 [Chamaesiphon sp.]